MKIETFSKNSMGQNIYLCWCGNSKEGVLIDAGCNEADEKAIMQTINNEGITLKAILLTHGHYDHITAVKKMKSLTNAPVYSHISEKQVLENPDLNLSCRILTKISVTPDELFNDGDAFEFGDCTLKVLHTPGHTPGGVCYYDADGGNLFAGDTLFASSIGRTDFPMGDHAKLVRNITAKLLTLPDDTMVYPGHGGTTTIWREKASNPYL